jgi:hypothetical protein
VDPFIDPEGYRAYIDTAEAEFRQGGGSVTTSVKPKRFVPKFRLSLWRSE